MGENTIKAACARRPGRLFIYLLTPLVRLRSGEQVKPRVDSPPHSRPGVESNRVPACILRAIDHPERPPSPRRSSTAKSVANPSASSRRLLTLSPPLFLSLSLALIHSKNTCSLSEFSEQSCQPRRMKRGGAYVRAQLQADWDSNRTRQVAHVFYNSD